MQHGSRATERAHKWYLDLKELLELLEVLCTERDPPAQLPVCIATTEDQSAALSVWRRRGRWNLVIHVAPTPHDRLDELEEGMLVIEYAARCLGRAQDIASVEKVAHVPSPCDTCFALTAFARDFNPALFHTMLRYCPELQRARAALWAAGLRYELLPRGDASCVTYFIIHPHQYARAMADLGRWPSGARIYLASSLEAALQQAINKLHADESLKIGMRKIIRSNQRRYFGRLFVSNAKSNAKCDAVRAMNAFFKNKDARVLQ